MAITVEVDSVDRTVELSTISGYTWTNSINGRGQARLTFRDTIGGFAPDDGNTVEILEGGTPRFWGMITDWESYLEGADAADTVRYYDIEVGGYELLIEKRLVFGKYNAKSIGFIVSDINTKRFGGEGLTVSVDAISGTDEITVTFNGETGAEAMDILCELADDGRTWWIDDSFVLQCKKINAIAAPATLDKTNVLMDPKPRWRKDRSTYRNIQIVRGHAGEEGEFPIIGRHADSSEIAARAAAEPGSGKYEEIAELSDIKKLRHANTAAKALVGKHGAIRKVFVGATEVSGFEPGQEVTVNLPNLGPSSVTMFIEQVETRLPPGGNEFVHVVHAITEDPAGGWRQLWRHRRKYPPQARYWEDPPDDNKGKRRHRKRKPQLVVMEGKTRRDGFRVGIPRGGRHMMPRYTGDGVTRLVHEDGYFEDAMAIKDGGAAVTKAYAKANKTDADDFGSIVDDAGGAWRKVKSVNSSNETAAASLGTDCVTNPKILAAAVHSAELYGLGQVLSSTVATATYVNADCDETFEMQHNFDTDARFNSRSHSLNRASYYNDSGSNQGYSITRSWVEA